MTQAAMIHEHTDCKHAAWPACGRCSESGPSHESQFGKDRDPLALNHTLAHTTASYIMAPGRCPGFPQNMLQHCSA